MDLQWLILMGLTIAVLPLVGTLLAMMLGTLITLRQRRSVMSVTQRRGFRDHRLEALLQRATSLLGYSVEGQMFVAAGGSRMKLDSRVTPDRRFHERRAYARRQQARPEVDRRRTDRRRNERRQTRMSQQRG